MANDNINKIANDEDLQEDFFITLGDETIGICTFRASKRGKCRNITIFANEKLKRNDYEED